MKLCKMNATLVARRGRSHHHLGKVSFFPQSQPSLTPSFLFPRPDHFPIQVFACHIPACSLSPFSAPHTPISFSLTFTMSQVKLQPPCRSVPPAAPESWFQWLQPAGPRVQEILHSLEHQTCPGQADCGRNTASMIKEISNRHVQIAISGGQIWARFMKIQMVHSQFGNYPSAQFQVLFPKHAG